MRKNKKFNKLRADKKWGIIFIIWTIVAIGLVGAVTDSQVMIFKYLGYVVRIIAGLLYLPIPFFLFIWIAIHRKSKRNEEGNVLSVKRVKEYKDKIPKKIYKYCSLSASKLDSLNDSKLKTLKCNQVWLSACDSLNDPFEGQIFYYPDDKDDEPLPEKYQKDGLKCYKDVKELLEKDRDKFIQTSFSEDYTNNLMWGHYANGCLGYCVEYDVIDTDFLFPVVYTEKRVVAFGYSSDKKREKMISKSLAEIMRNFFAIGPGESISYMLYLQSLKNAEWEYEKEIRLIEMGFATCESKCGNVPIEHYGLKATKIIIGYKCVYKNELIEIAKELGIECSIMAPSYADDTYVLKEKTI